MLFAGCLALLFVPSAAAHKFGNSGPQPLALVATGQQISGWVEQESGPTGFPSFDDCMAGVGPCVWNTTGCLWNVSDYSSAIGNGYLDSGVSVSASQCYIADGFENTTGDNKQWRVEVDASSSELAVTLTNDQGVSLTAGPPFYRLDLRLWEYSICTYDLSGFGGPYPEIPNPDGIGPASGLRVVDTATITNPTGRNAKTVYGDFYSTTDIGAQQGPC